ncbi:hypothetical protein ACL02O_07865 [Micromonospora sp. MS34]|uniref:hypothetical protein n=1 Tax=Micromonospora sp. MS34 TaxID=3385971 RepID=UPI0039A09C8B
MARSAALVGQERPAPAGALDGYASSGAGRRFRPAPAARVTRLARARVEDVADPASAVLAGPGGRAAPVWAGLLPAWGRSGGRPAGGRRVTFAAGRG